MNWDHSNTLGKGTYGYFRVGYLQEVLFFNHKLRDAERNAVEDYLSKKWPISL